VNLLERPMDLEQIRSALLLHDPADGTILRHGFSDSFRDYELEVEIVNPESTCNNYTFKFILCVVANIECILPTSVLTHSLNDRLLKLPPPDISGYVWGVNALVLYPGWHIDVDSEIAREWSNQTGLPFFDIVFETNVQRIELVFTDVKVSSSSIA
jgi:hypothetical protein